MEEGKAVGVSTFNNEPRRGYMARIQQARVF